MAASVLGRRTAVFFRTLAGVPLKPGGCPSGVLLQIASYNPKPLKLNVKEPYIPDKDSDKTPEWQKTFKYDRKLYGRYGSASGIDPATLWPRPEQLEHMIEEEKLWQPSLQQMMKNLRRKEKEETEKRLAKEKLIADSMAKMPKMLAEWRREKRETRQKKKEEKERRNRLLALARERFGFAVDPRSSKFADMVAEIENEEKKRKKLMKRQLKEEKMAAYTMSLPAASPSSS